MKYSSIYTRLIYPVYHWAMKDGANRAIRDMNRNESLGRESLEAAIQGKLVNLIRHAKANVPYYQKLLSGLDLNGEDIAKHGNLSNVPLLTRSIINSNLDELASLDLTGNGLDMNSTGGSTGEVLRFYTDWRSGACRKATVRRNKRWLGIEPGDREIRLWGAPLDLDRSRSLRGRFHAAITQERFMSADTLDESTLSSYYELCSAFAPKLLVAYPSALMEFARYCQSRGSRFDSVKAIICSAETLFDHDRSYIENAFGVRIFNRYGCREVGDIAQEAPGVNGLLVNSDRVYVEILNSDGNSCEPGEQGEVVVTDLDNYGMPLIRYRIGDFARWALPHDSGDNSHPFPVLASVDGRTLDVVCSPTGHRIGGTYWTLLLRSKPGFRKIQVIQRSSDKVQILYSGEEGVQPDFDYFRQEIVKKCGEELRVEFVEVERFEHEPGTKFRLVISDLT